ncbi:hypothetical protein M7I_8318 [Glarea lozoyensis 74030]|uniref:Uncharacterized protein n=1 Tax=Glarea lozoyensis (strain ATCC 74030 / MF5533) TaxID=1104152 RepID=H0EZP2_GLAL7|nr:hypothetical protein M7I_8318 [Glarea lozoyensis 74030]
MNLILTLTVVASVAQKSLATVPYSNYILAPESRTIYPPRIHQVNGTLTNSKSLIGGPNGTATFNGVSSITFDYTKNIGGVVSVKVGKSSSPDAFVGLTYTESSLWINGQGSDATADAGLDEVIWLPVGEGPGTYTVERKYDRGAFRYLSVVSNSSATIDVQGVSVYYTAAPAQDLRGYSGYFHSNDELLNRVWYAVTWYNNATITEGRSAMTDGAKRDREVWPGDIHWDNFKRGLAWSLSYIDETGLMNVTSSADWLRVGMGGHDGNAWAVKANLTLSTAQSSAITNALKSRWGTYGAPSPEAGVPLTISPFIGSFELEAHFIGQETQDALDLIRLQWGFMLNDPRPTSLMSFYIAGLHLTSSIGRTWKISPALGDLTDVDAGFETPLGKFSSTLRR